MGKLPPLKICIAGQCNVERDEIQGFKESKAAEASICIEKIGIEPTNTYKGELKTNQVNLSCCCRAVKEAKRKIEHRTSINSL